MSQSVVGALRVNLGLDSAQFSKGLNDAQGALQKAGQRMRQVGTQMSAAMTVPLAGLAGVTLKTAGDFEASMNRVQAALGATEGEFNALREIARDMGSTTQFSASEAADAIEVLAKNGASTADILGGALEASLTLAAASSAEMSSAADVATDVMANFGKRADEMGTVVDGMTGVLLESKFGFDDYRQALAQAGGVAGGLGVDFEEFNAVIAATSSSFASGSDAGTSFKTFLQRLSPDTKEAAETMQRLGIEFYDAQGQLKGMADVAGELQAGMAGLSEEAQSSALSDIFGADAVRTAIGLMREGTEGIKELEGSIAGASASDQAAARMEGLNGTMKELRSAFEELQLVIADSGLLEVFTNIVKGTADLARALGDLNPRIVQIGVVFAGLAAALGPLLVGAGIVIAAAGGPAFAITLAIAGLTAAAIAFYPEIKRAKDAVVDFAVAFEKDLSELSATITEMFRSLPGEMIQIGQDMIAGLWEGLQSKFNAVKEGIRSIPQKVIGIFRDETETRSPSQVFRRLGNSLMEGLGLGIGETGAEVGGAMQGIAASLSRDIKGLFDGVLRQGQSFKDALSSMFGNVADRLLGSGIDALFGSLFGGGPLNAIPALGPLNFGGMRAMGGPVSPGNVYGVGENGPEWFVPNRSGQIVPNGGGAGEVDRAGPSGQRREPPRVRGAHGGQRLDSGDAAV